MNIVEMREKRAKLWNTMEGFLETHRNASGCLSTEDDAIYNNMEQELNALTNEIKRMERRDAIEAELRQPAAQPIVTMPQQTIVTDTKVGRVSDAYKEDFGKMLRQKNFASNVLSTTPGSDGGYLCPTEFDESLVKRWVKQITVWNNHITVELKSGVSIDIDA